MNTGAPYRLVETLDGTTRRTHGLPGDVAVVPAGAELAVRSADGAPQEVESLVVSLSGALVDEVLDAAGAHPDRHALLPAVGSRSLGWPSWRASSAAAWPTAPTWVGWRSSR